MVVIRLLSAFLHGFVLALGLILPLGAQNVFVFNQGARQAKFRRALPAVVTAAFCDTLLLTVAVLGVSVLILSVPAVKSVLLGAGVLFLLYIGWVTWRSEGSGGSGEQPEPYSPGRQVAYALSVSLLNPHAIMDTVGVIGASSLAYSGWEKLAFAASCIAVSWLWFLALAWAGRMAGSLGGGSRLMRGLSRVSAALIWASAAVMLATWL